MILGEPISKVGLHERFLRAGRGYCDALHPSGKPFDGYTLVGAYKRAEGAALRLPEGSSRSFADSVLRELATLGAKEARRNRSELTEATLGAISKTYSFVRTDDSLGANYTIFKRPDNTEVWRRNGI